MKRGKVDDKVMEPMFPRLHVNDTEKGGPRAPPRNKMALYEQLSVPSQRFNQGWLPVRPDSVNSVPPPSSSQVNGADRKIFFPVHLPLSNPTFIPEKLNRLESDRSNTNTSLARLEQQNKSSDEDDYTVPVFAHSQEVQEKNQNSKNNKDFLPISPNHLCHHSMTQTQNSGPEKNLAVPKNVNGESKEVDNCSHESGSNDSPREIEVANSSKPKSDSLSGPTVKSEDVSEASILDSVSAMDISPDDVLGIIGNKHFWKARRAIVNQQRVFAGQVFELHRLIKVQKLIASSPDLLLEDASTTLSKPSSTSSPATQLLLENNNKSPSPATKHIDKPQKPNQPMECSAENVVGQTPVFANTGAPPGPPTVPSLGACPPQHQAPGQQQWLIPLMSPTEGLVYKPYPGPGFSSTGFCGPYGSSPMMMSNFGNPAYGVPSVQGMGFIPGIPHVGHSYFPTYGMPVISVGDPDGGSGSVSVSATEQVNCWTKPTPGIQTGHVLRQEPKQPQLKTSCNSNAVPVPQTAPTSVSLQPLKFSDLQGSAGSSRPRDDRAEPTQTGSLQHPCPSNEPAATERGSFSKRARDPGNVRREYGKDELPLFPMTPAAADTERSARVIRAVPRSAGSASASVARIFRAIQDERKHYDSV